MSCHLILLFIKWIYDIFIKGASSEQNNIFLDKFDQILIWNDKQM